MEKHIFKFGAGSLAIIIPKKWAEKRGLGPSSAVSLEEDESGGLRITTNRTGRLEIQRIVGRATGAALLARWVGLDYMYGVWKLRVYSKEGLGRAQLDAIEGKIGGECPGFEITAQSNNEVVIEDFTDIGGVSIDKMVARLKSLIEQELDELLADNAETVKKIERLVNRYYMLGVRYVNLTQAKDALRYLVVLQQLEAISDNLSDVSSERAVDRKVFGMMKRQFAKAFEGYEGDIRAVEWTAAMREDIIRLISSQKFNSYSRHLMHEATNAISGISEFGLKAAEKRGEFTVPLGEQPVSRL